MNNPQTITPTHSRMFLFDANPELSTPREIKHEQQKIIEQQKAIFFEQGGEIKRVATGFSHINQAKISASPANKNNRKKSFAAAKQRRQQKNQSTQLAAHQDD